MQYQYRFAGVEYSVVGEPDVIFDQERTLAPFRVPTTDNPHIIRLEKVAQLPPPEGEIIARSGLAIPAPSATAGRALICVSGTRVRSTVYLSANASSRDGLA